MRTRTLRRSVVAGTTLAVAMAVGAPAAMADEVTDVLDRAREATYTATRLTVSVWGAQTQISRERVEHTRGMEMILVDETWLMVGNGRSVVMNDAPEGIAFMSSVQTMPSDRYQVGTTEECRHMRRSCTLVPILESGVVRAQMIVDNRTGAPLISYVYDGGGRLYRTVSLSEFKPHRTYEWSQDPASVPLEIVMHGESDELPAAVAGYRLGDVFPGPTDDRSEQGYYSDGLFSFSLFVLPSSAVVGGFDDAGTLVGASGVYAMVHTANDVRVQWSNGSERFVLMGDLPPDHLEMVLAELPAPDKRSMLARLWAKLFG